MRLFAVCCLLGADKWAKKDGSGCWQGTEWHDREWMWENIYPGGMDKREEEEEERRRNIVVLIAMPCAIIGFLLSFSLRRRVHNNLHILITPMYTCHQRFIHSLSSFIYFILCLFLYVLRHQRQKRQSRCRWLSYYPFTFESNLAEIQAKRRRRMLFDFGRQNNGRALDWTMEDASMLLDGQLMKKNGWKVLLMGRGRKLTMNGKKMWWEREREVK